MNDYLYIPISSQNFNNLFSSESISPPAHYFKRDFGIRRYVDVYYGNYTEYILLYTAPPEIKLPDDDSDATLFYVRVNAEDVPQLIPAAEAGNEKVYVTENTIYFNFSDVSFIFKDAGDIKRIVAKSLSSFETKTVKKYSTSFRTLKDIGTHPKYIPFKKLNLSRDTTNVRRLIEEERLHDKFKGFVYAYFIGSVFAETKELIRLKREIRNLIDEWGILKNKLSLTSLNKDSESQQNKNVVHYRSKLIDSLRSIAVLVRNIQPSGNSEAPVREYVKKVMESEKVEDFLSNVKKVPGLFRKLEEISAQQTETISYLLRSIEELINLYCSTVTTSFKSNQREAIDVSLKEDIYKLSNKIEVFKYNRNPAAPLPKLNCISLHANRVYLDKSAVAINGEDLFIFEMILNTLFERTRVHISETPVEEKLEILKVIGNAVKERLGESSMARSYLLNLYNSVSGDTKIDVKQTKYQSLACLSAFISKPDSMEQMSDYLQRNDIGESYLAYSYWGMYNGFASTGRIFTKPVIESPHPKYMDALDSYLISVLTGKKKERKEPASLLITETVKTEPNALEEIENNPEFSLHLDRIKSWLNEIVEKMQFGGESSPPYNVNLLRENFVKTFCTPKRKGVTQDLAKKLFKKINLELAFKAKAQPPLQ